MKRIQNNVLGCYRVIVRNISGRGTRTQFD